MSFTDSGWTVEAKFTDKQRFSVTRPMIDKIKTAANLRGDNWMIQVDFCNPHTGKVEKRLAIVDYDVLMGMNEQLCQEEDDE